MPVVNVVEGNKKKKWNISYLNILMSKKKIVNRIQRWDRNVWCENKLHLYFMLLQSIKHFSYWKKKCVFVKDQHFLYKVFHFYFLFFLISEENMKIQLENEKLQWKATQVPHLETKGWTSWLMTEFWCSFLDDQTVSAWKWTYNSEVCEL